MTQSEMDSKLINTILDADDVLGAFEYAISLCVEILQSQPARQILALPASTYESNQARAFPSH